MNIDKSDDLRIASVRSVTTPMEILEELPCTSEISSFIASARKTAANIIRGKDDRLLVVIGPCSIHDPEAAYEYALKLKKTAEALTDVLFIVMRVYFEKPRTTVGWKGLINDPELDDGFHINHGLRVARQLLIRLADLRLPTGTEYLEIITPQYINDLITWGAIGARTTESQVHRELASGLSCPVGFKNGTTGNVQIAIDAIRSASHPHHFLSLRKEGTAAIFSTYGNQDCHLILRGGGGKTNYDEANVKQACDLLSKVSLAPRLMVDCSHANSNKEFKKQIDVAEHLGQQIALGSKAFLGMMIESNLTEGRQDVSKDVKLLNYGQSITDACLGWDDSEQVLHQLADAVRKGISVTSN